MADKVSPEEKLFRVIREGKKEGAKPPSGPHGMKKFFANLSLGKKMFTAIPKPMRAAISGAPGAFSITLSEIKPKTVNTTLAIALVCITIIVIYVAISERSRVAVIAGRVSKIPAGPVRTKAIETFKPMSFYLSELEKREIFQPASTAKSLKEAAPEKVALDKLKVMAADFTLQGISWGQNPKAMVKSAKEDKMYFLGEGQTIGVTGVKMKAIYRNKIVVSYEEAEMELL